MAKRSSRPEFSSTVRNSTGNTPFARGSAAEGQTDRSETIRQWLLAACVALWVSTPLLPSEATIVDGTFAPLAMLWTLLSIAFAAWQFLPASSTEQAIRQKQTWQVAEWLALALVAWLVISGIFSFGKGNTRATLHGIWLVIGYGLGTYLLSRLIRTMQEVRWILLIFLGLAIALALHGLYQYAVTFPQMRAAFDADREQIVKETSINADPNSEEHQLFENRIRSKEPLATFSLTNSFAGFLAPWTLLALGLVPTIWKNAGRSRGIALWVVIALLMAILLLTKSRTALLAVFAGVVLFAAGQTRVMRSVGWKIPLAMGAGLVLLAVSAFASGGLDIQVFSEAPKSILYRLEYWLSSRELIAEHPLFGVGLGNFQSHYAAYKLPQASEMVADPHNILVELAALGGAPAALLALSLVGWIVRDAFLLRKSEGVKASSALQNSSSSTPLLTGAFVGIFLGAMLAIILGYPLNGRMVGGTIGLIVIGLPLAALWIYLQKGWADESTDDESSEATFSLIAAILVALFVWGLNLLAAGALVFPGVFLSAAILVAILRSAVFAFPASPHNSVQIDSTLMKSGVLLVAFILAFLCAKSEYLPTLQARPFVEQAADRLASSTLIEQAEKLSAKAIAIDPYNPTAQQLHANTLYLLMLKSPSEQREQSLEKAMEAWRDSNPASYGMYQQQAQWDLTLFRLTKKSSWLEKARASAQHGIDRYPAGAYGYVQRAQLEKIAGEVSLSRLSAQKALDLDAAMPHADQKLAKKELHDVEFRLGALSSAPKKRADLAAQELAGAGEGPKTK